MAGRYAGDGIFRRPSRTASGRFSEGFSRRRAHVAPDEVAVFWACGVTSQAAIEAARPDFSITHKPGHMLITDLANELCAMSARS